MKSKKVKEVKPNQLYKDISNVLVLSDIDPNILNVKIVLEELDHSTEYYVQEIISLDDVRKIVLKKEIKWYSALAYRLATHNQKQIDQVRKYLKSINKEEKEN